MGRGCDSFLDWILYERGFVYLSEICSFIGLQAEILELGSLT